MAQAILLNPRRGKGRRVKSRKPRKTGRGSKTNPVLAWPTFRSPKEARRVVKSGRVIDSATKTVFMLPKKRKVTSRTRKPSRPGGNPVTTQYIEVAPYDSTWSKTVSKRYKKSRAIRKARVRARGKAKGPKSTVSKKQPMSVKREMRALRGSKYDRPSIVTRKTSKRKIKTRNNPRYRSNYRHRRRHMRSNPYDIKNFLKNYIAPAGFGTIGFALVGGAFKNQYYNGQIVGKISSTWGKALVHAGVGVGASMLTPMLRFVLKNKVSSNAMDNYSLAWVVGCGIKTIQKIVSELPGTGTVTAYLKTGLADTSGVSGYMCTPSGMLPRQVVNDYVEVAKPSGRMNDYVTSSRNERISDYEEMSDYVEL